MIKRHPYARYFKGGEFDAFLLGRYITSRNEYLWNARNGNPDMRSTYVKTARYYHREALSYIQRVRGAHQPTGDR